MTTQQECFLKFDVDWRDEHMFKMIITSCNTGFCGITNTYVTPAQLINFAIEIGEFSQSVNSELFFEIGKKDAHSYFSMRCYQIDYSGVVGVEIMIESDVATEYRPEEKSKLKTELIVELRAIDEFRKQLYSLVSTSEGQALLLGRYSSRID